MKTTLCILILFLAGLELPAQTPPRLRSLPSRIRATNNAAFNPAAIPTAPGFPGMPSAAANLPPRIPSPQPSSPSPNGNAPATVSSSNPPGNKPAEEIIPAGDINFQGVDVSQVLDVYARLVNRTVLHAGLPAAQIILKTQTPLTKSEAIEALQGVLALNGISLIPVGDKFVKAVPSDQAGAAAAALDFSSNPTNLPDLGSYVTRIVQLHYVKPSEVVPIIQPLAKLNSIIPIDDNGILVIRDYAENVKRMLQLIQKIDVNVPEEYVSEVIPIKYAMADDIANALNSLGGSGGSAVTIGGSTASTPVNGFGSQRTGASGFGNSSGGNFQNNGYNNSTTRSFGSTTPNGTPNSGSTFQSRIRQIINNAASGGQQQQQFEVFGQAKIIADERSNSLLVFATQADMAKIKNVVNQLDVLLAQVLIESVVMDVSLNKGFQFGVSAAQGPQSYGQNYAGGGGMQNGPSFLNFLTRSNGFALGTNSSGIFGNVLSSGLSYFGNIGPNWNVALQAAASDSSVTVIQRPRIQTSQAKPASFFVGETVPYVTSTYNGGVGYGNSSSYSQLSVGVELDVTPFINPEGLVVMDIDQEIDDLNGSTFIEGVGDVPNTTKRTLSSEIAVQNRDTVLLGGFIRSDSSKSKSGVPFLQDIPLLGNLFTSRNDSKDREETVVLIRPTVLQTPALAAAQTIEEEKRLPGVSRAALEDKAYENELVQQEQAFEARQSKGKKSATQGNNFFTPVSSDGFAATNNPPAENLQ